MHFRGTERNNAIIIDNLRVNRKMVFFQRNNYFAMPGNLGKILIFSLLLLSVGHRVSAPNRESLVIVASPPVEPYKKLIHAIGMVETMFDTLAYNPVEKAAGYFQIRPIRLEDYNKRTGNKYTMKDLFNYEISEKIFLYYAVQIGPYDQEKIARRWNGSGTRTIHYWNRIKKYL
jgi:hypothetical protein